MRILRILICEVIALQPLALRTVNTPTCLLIMRGLSNDAQSFFYSPEKLYNLESQHHKVVTLPPLPPSPLEVWGGGHGPTSLFRSEPTSRGEVGGGVMGTVALGRRGESGFVGISWTFGRHPPLCIQSPPVPQADRLPSPSALPPMTPLWSIGLLFLLWTRGLPCGAHPPPVQIVQGLPPLSPFPWVCVYGCLVCLRRVWGRGLERGGGLYDRFGGGG